ncbi:hypothetical protein I2I05_09680 [Hymenobacter sp. BT683]|uniref:DUF4304 domain-containing protein n=1 Tax=Hymenobacter jeongseonensis TaxID=2791027 RepID=A0ABS0IHY5_9BACT|nr:hypothetical protein [Hymenobacter jeongseonensis]MBF9237664.1 hypothetical protein [Hymenobacter jeongseonensis]
MTSRDLRNALLTAVAADLLPFGFVLNRAQAEFTQRTPDGWNKVQLVFLWQNPGWEIKAGFLIRLHRVEQIYHQASYFEPKYHRSTPTIGIPLENLLTNGQTSCATLCTAADVAPCLEWMKGLFEDQAQPFFARYHAIPVLEQAVNAAPGTGLFSGLKYEGNVGMILAKLVDSPAYTQLQQRYRKHYEWLANGFYLPEYEKLLKVLEEI